MSDVRGQMVTCRVCGKRYRCTPNSDYFQLPSEREIERTTTSGRCWDCHLEVQGVAPQPEPQMGDVLYPNSPGAPALSAITVKEMVASIALSHPDDCVCLTCRAAHGDVEAMAEVLDMLDREQEAQRADR